MGNMLLNEHLTKLSELLNAMLAPYFSQYLGESAFGFTPGV